MKNILVTGGLGYIGSHTVTLLKNYNVTIIDNLSNSNIEVLDNITKITNITPKFHKVDLSDTVMVDRIFHYGKFDYVIHFAGSKSVNDSITNPIEYYNNNISNTLKLVTIMKNHNVKNLLFSSSAAVYGDAKELPIVEDTIKNPNTPYGRTKSIIEDMLQDIYNSDNSWNITNLRYFNPVGCHPSYLIGDNKNSINLMSIICRVANGEDKYLGIYGDDYDTKDGSAIRDYIHVMDLANGHVAALDNLKGFNIINLGTGQGISVFELINSFQSYNNIRIPYMIMPRRHGDIVVSYANVDHAKDVLGWSTKLDSKDMCRDAWEWFKLSKIS
jgi:UDP-glucose 4-epimerase